MTISCSLLVFKLLGGCLAERKSPGVQVGTDLFEPGLVDSHNKVASSFRIGAHDSAEGVVKVESLINDFSDKYSSVI